jgi:hypothetical protein
MVKSSVDTRRRLRRNSERGRLKFHTWCRTVPVLEISEAAVGRTMPGGVLSQGSGMQFYLKALLLGIHLTAMSGADVIGHDTR